MSVFTEYSFRRYLDRLIAIHPLREDSITGVGYDLTVGLYASVDPRKKVITSVQVHAQPNSARISLDPYSYVIVISRENVHLSSRVAATFHSKSSLAAQAVFLNSTTGDPNWNGRLIFSLYNASGIRVDLDLDATFATMVVHETKGPSHATPKESKAVIEKYLSGLTGEHDKIVGYVMRDNEYTDEFRKRATRVRRLAALPPPILELWITLRLGCLIQVVRKYWFASLCAFLALAFFSAVPLLLSDRPSLAESAQVASIISAVCAVLGIIFRKR